MDELLKAHTPARSARAMDRSGCANKVYPVAGATPRAFLHKNAALHQASPFGFAEVQHGK
jgi:hypothetical protein